MTNSMRAFLSIFILLFLSACSSPKGYISHPNYKMLNNALYDSSFPQVISDDGTADDPVFKAAFAKDANFAQTHEALSKLNLKSMSLEQICLPEHQRIIQDYLAISPVHLHLTFITYSCAKVDNEADRIASTQKAFQQVVQFIQQSGSGLTPNDPIQLTDYQDIELLSYVSETTILGVDLSLRSNGTFIKAHTFDRAYQRFEYRYYSMSKYLQSKIAPLTGELAPVNMLNMLREASLHPKSSNLGLVLRGKQQYQLGKHEFVSILLNNAIEKQEKKNTNQASYYDNYPLMVTLYFQALLADKKLQDFDNAVSKLEEVSAMGSIEAMGLLSLRELFNETPSIEVINKNLEEISYIYEQDSAELVLLSLILSQPNYAALLSTWLGESPNDMQLDAVLEMSRRYKFGAVEFFDSDKMRTLIETAFKTEVDGSKTQMAFLMRFFEAKGPNFIEEHRFYTEAATETNDKEYKAEALYQLADIYFYGNTAIEADKQKALTYYQQAAENGHMQAAYNLAAHFIDQTYDTPTNAPIISLLRQAAPIRPDAYCLLGNLLATTDKVAAKSAFIAGANRAQPSCAFQIGILEKQAENYQVAGYWFRKSARAEYLPAIEQLALLYQNGQGTDINLKKATVLRNYLNAVPFE